MINLKKHLQCLINGEVPQDSGFGHELVSGHLGKGSFILVMETKVHLMSGGKDIGMLMK